MSRYQMKRAGMRAVLTSLLLTVVFAAGSATGIYLYPPSFVGGEGRLDSERASSGLSVEDLVVHPGKSVSRGEPLCSVAYHSKLYFEGTAFEDDLPILERIAENAWQITIESRGPSAHDRESLYLQRLNPAIEKVARYLNIYAAAGKEKTTGNFALVFHGDATLAILNSEAYQTEFGTKGNPNSELLTQLHEAGVEMYVCGQSLHAKGKRPQDVLVFVKTAVSAPTASVNLQSEG